MNLSGRSTFFNLVDSGLSGLRFCLGHLNFGDWNLFRISDFEFRISGLSGLGRQLVKKSLRILSLTCIRPCGSKFLTRHNSWLFIEQGRLHFPKSQDNLRKFKNTFPVTQPGQAGIENWRLKIEDLLMSLRSVIIKMDRSTQSFDPVVRPWGPRREVLEGRFSKGGSRREEFLSEPSA